MLEAVVHLDGILRAGINALTAKGAKSQMINPLVKFLFLFSFRCFHRTGNDFDGTVGAIHLAYGTARAQVLIIFVVRKNHFALKPFGDV